MDPNHDNKTSYRVCIFLFLCHQPVLSRAIVNKDFIEFLSKKWLSGFAYYLDLIPSNCSQILLCIDIYTPTHNQVCYQFPDSKSINPNTHTTSRWEQLYTVFLKVSLLLCLSTMAPNTNIQPRDKCFNVILWENYSHGQIFIFPTILYEVRTNLF